MDQAHTLRQLTGHAERTRPMQIYSITSGKGGVGKTSLVCNMAARFGQLGRRVLLIDADMGLANVDIMMGVRTRMTIEHLFSGEAALSDILVAGPPGVTVLPSGTGVQSLTHLTDDQILRLLSALDELPEDYDVLLIDTGAGIGRNVLYFNAAANDVIVVTNPEPTALTDAYAVIKVLSREHQTRRFQLIVNQVADRREALRVYRHLTTVADEHLTDVAIEYLGHVVRDPLVSEAVRERRLLIEGHPDSPAAGCIHAIVAQLDEQANSAGPASGNLQFFWRRLLRAGA